MRNIVLIVGFAACSLLSMGAVAQKGETTLPDVPGPWAVNAYYTDENIVIGLAEDFDVWSIDKKAKTVLLAIYDVEEYKQLAGRGFHLELNQPLMQKYANLKLLNRSDNRTIPGFACYRTVAETFATQDTLVSTYPNLVSLIDIGDTWEKEQDINQGSDMRVLKITNSNIVGDKPILYAMGSIHSREYAPAEITTRFAEYLLENYGTDADATWLVDYHEIHLLMQGNPDGREVSEAETFPGQRKNRNANHCASGNRGVDMNRNFGFLWNQGTGSSGNQCSDAYRGTAAVSEPETDAINSYIDTLFVDNRGPNLTDPAPLDTTGVYLDLHSFSNLVLWPYGYSDGANPAPNHPQLRTLGRRLAWFNGYRPEQSNASLGGADGASDDNAYGRLGVAAYTLEIGSNSEGFYIPCNNFNATHLPNNLDALVYAAKVARTPYITASGPDSINLQLDSIKVAAGTSLTLTGTATDAQFSSANGTEPTNAIANVNAYVDVPPWEAGAVAVALNSTDGNYDSVSENFTGLIDTTGLAEGQHIIYVESADSSAAGAISAIFFDVVDSGAFGTLQGIVTDSVNNQPLADVILALNGQMGTTDSLGAYSIDVTDGIYDLTLTKSGYVSQTIEDVNITAEMTTVQDVQMVAICTLVDENVDTFANIQAAEAAGWSHVAISGTDDWRVNSGDDHTTGLANAFVSTDVDSVSDKSLQTPIVNISDQATLNFWHKYEFESTANDDYDGGVLEVSTDNGVSWQALESEIIANGYTGDLNNNFGNPLGGRNAWTGSQTEFVQVEVDLTAFGGSDIQVRWRLGTDSSEGAGDWLIDDIQIVDPVACQGPTDVIFADGFETL